MDNRYRFVASQALFAGALLTIYGWFLSAKGISSSVAYNAIVDVFYWTLRVGGPLMLLAGAACFAGLRPGILIDAVAAGICGVVMLVYALAGVFTGVGIGVNNLLALVFGVLFLSSARRSMEYYLSSRGSPARMGARPAPEARPVAEAVHPASVRPASLPAEGEPPPEEGYLAALAREDDEPPSAAHR